MEICLLRRCMYIFFCILANQANTAQVCRDDQHVAELPDGNVTCLDCQKCPPGSGVTIPCGNKIPYNASVECEACVPGFYSDSYSSESCKPCSNCSRDEVMVTACTKTSNSRCSCKLCPKGYYRNQTLSKCLPCTGCCSDDVDIVVPQCVYQGMPRTQSCSYHKRKPCMAKCWYDEITVVKHDGRQVCLPCPVCSNYFGLTKPCGGFIRDGVIPKCERPILGKTFVNQQGILQFCKICSTGQNVIADCSAKSDTICGGCKPGFYFNDLSKTCEECFWCCRYSDSKNVMECIRKGMMFAEHYQASVLGLPFVSSLDVSEQSGELLAKEQETYPVVYLKLDEVTANAIAVGLFFVLFLLTAFNFISKRNDFGNRQGNGGYSGLSSLKTRDGIPQQKEYPSETIETPQNITPGKKEVELEYPTRKNRGHVVFEKTGVEVVTLDNTKSSVQRVPSDLALHATSDGLEIPGLLEDGEFPLSPAIKLISSTKLTGPLEVQIPHGANMVLSSNKWKVFLKELLNNIWVVVSNVEGSGIKEFFPKSNHVSFEADHFSTFAVVGYCEKHSLSVFKRMKVMAFCSETRVGEDLIVRLYCFDDCEWSFENLMRKERMEGGKLMSSVESLDFSVTCEEDVEIFVKDIDGWKIESSCPMKFSYTSLRNSFSTTPQCNLVFNNTSVERNGSFFTTIVLAQARKQTMLYASTAIKEDPTLRMNVKVSQATVNEGTQMANITTSNDGEEKEQATDCIIQL